MKCQQNLALVIHIALLWSAGIDPITVLQTYRSSGVKGIIVQIAIRRVLDRLGNLSPLATVCVWCRREFQFPTLVLVPDVPINRDFADAQLVIYQLGSVDISSQLDNQGRAQTHDTS